MDGGIIDAWRIGLTTCFALIGFVLRYLFIKIQGIVPESDIRQIVKDTMAPEVVKQAMIYERLIHIEQKLDKLLEEKRNNHDNRNSH